MDRQGMLHATQEMLLKSNEHAMSLAMTAKSAIQFFLNKVGMSNDCFKQLLCGSDPVPVMNNDGKVYLSFAGTDTYTNCQSLEKLITALKEPHTTISSTDDVENTLNKNFVRHFDEYQPHDSKDMISPKMITHAVLLHDVSNLNDSGMFSSYTTLNKNPVVHPTSDTSKDEAAAISNKALHEIPEDIEYSTSLNESEYNSSSSISLRSPRKEVCDDITNSVDCNYNFENDESVAWSEQSDSFQNESESNLCNPILPTLSDEVNDDLSSNDNSDIIFDCSFQDVRKDVLSQRGKLKRHYKKEPSKCKFDVAYIDTKRAFKVLRSNSLSEAKLRAFNLKDIQRVPFAVVLIANGDESSQCKSKKQSTKFLSKVGLENSPSISGILHSVLDDEHREFSMTFYLDTGADSGSIGYNYDIVQHCILTVDNVNGLLQPAILCKVSSETITGEKVQIFDIDIDPNWNAIGLATLKNYKFYIDNKKPRVVMGKYNEVTIKDTEKTVEVTFPQNVVTGITA